MRVYIIARGQSQVSTDMRVASPKDKHSLGYVLPPPLGGESEDDVARTGYALRMQNAKTRPLRAVLDLQICRQADVADLAKCRLRSVVHLGHGDALRTFRESQVRGTQRADEAQHVVKLLELRLQALITPPHTLNFPVLGRAGFFDQVDVTFAEGERML